MKRFKTIILVMALISAFTAGAGYALDTNLPVNANIIGSCTMTAAAVNFGEFTSNGQPVDGEGTLDINCSQGLDYTISLDNGAHFSNGSRNMADGASMLSYGLFQDVGRDADWGTGASSYGSTGSGEETLTVYGRVYAGQVVPVGSYSDTVVATISW